MWGVPLEQKESACSKRTGSPEGDRLVDEQFMNLPDTAACTFNPTQEAESGSSLWVQKLGSRATQWEIPHLKRNNNNNKHNLWTTVQVWGWDPDGRGHTLTGTA